MYATSSPFKELSAAPTSPNRSPRFHSRRGGARWRAIEDFSDDSQSLCVSATTVKMHSHVKFYCTSPWLSFSYVQIYDQLMF